MTSVADNFSKVKIVVDDKSGFCFGVSRAVRMAEEQLDNNETLTSLGDIVHNNEEVLRLEKKGLRTISNYQMQELKTKKVLLRAHGEPPSTYELLKKQNIAIIDATCPVVLKLQHKVLSAWKKTKKNNGQIVIYGKKGHPEVAGLIGQTDGEAIVISNLEDLILINPKKPVDLFSQTTMSNEDFLRIEQAIRAKYGNSLELNVHNTICAQVENRVPHLKNFAKKFDIIILVGGEKSSNGKMLYDICKQVNPETYYVYGDLALQQQWFRKNIKSVGICGATSTPNWLMKKVAEKVNIMVNETS